MQLLKKFLNLLYFGTFAIDLKEGFNTDDLPADIDYKIMISRKNS